MTPNLRLPSSIPLDRPWGGPWPGIWLAAALPLVACPLFAATFTVTNANDSGPGSLRRAINDANTNSGSDTITFDLPGSGPHTIALLSALPAITSPVVIDATTQPGYAGRPLIELNGSGAGAASGLQLLAGHSTVRGLVINRFAADGIIIETGGTNVVQGNFIGVDTNGAAALANGQDGVLIKSAGNLVGGPDPGARNLISGNASDGVHLLGTSAKGNSVEGNYIGTDLSGLEALGNLANGVSLYQAGSNVIAGNLISGNASSGLYLGQPQASNNVVQGNFIGTTAIGDQPLGNGLSGLSLWSANNNVIGGTLPAARNVISGNRMNGIFITNSVGNWIAGNCIGLDRNGQGAVSNFNNGISLNGAHSNHIGGNTAAARNIISGNGVNGIQIYNGSSNNLVEGCYIGTDVSGTTGVGNGSRGVRIDSPNNTVGGTAPGARNLISANSRNGIYLNGSNALHNVIQGNYIGTTADGASALGNTNSGISLSGAALNLIGGAEPGAGNLVSGNWSTGVLLTGPGADANQIQGNRIGADSTGTRALANSFEGITCNGAVSNLIGGPGAGAGNLISGNTTRGIWLKNSSCNTLAGNSIGTADDNTTPLGNGTSGIDCDLGSTNNVIGGEILGAANFIAFNGGAGVAVRSGATNALNNRITGNSIFDNYGLGIDLGSTGVTPNDPCDLDTGGNQLQNAPALKHAVRRGGTLISGSLESAANSAFLLQFFANPTCDNSGYGQGRIHLGDLTVTTDSSCNADFTATLSVSVPEGFVVAATATDAGNNTSEFSACVPVVPMPALTMSLQSRQLLKVSWTNTAAGFVIKQTSSLTPPVVWEPVTNSVLSTNGSFTVLLPSPSGNRFYSLQLQ